ncbi:MAG: hypothetical protein ABJJ53_10715 [Sulfitobacter sp.]
MTTWSSKQAAALGMIFMLGACEDMGIGGLASLTAPDDTALPAVPLTQALMMRGAVTLVPPTGYCIDPDSLTQSFAMMARCDTLGAATGSSGAPAGLLTVSLSRMAKDASLPTAQEIATAGGLSSPQSVQHADTNVVFKTSGEAPASGLSPDHWRAVARVDRFSLGAALYGPDAHRAVSSEGAGVLQDMIKRTSETNNALQ